jgi:hypothetical protein
VQSTPEGGLRDRQVAHGEAISVARRLSWSRPPRSNGGRRGTESAACGAEAPAPSAWGEDPGAAIMEPAQGSRHAVLGFPSCTVKPQAQARTLGQEQGEGGRRPWVPGGQGWRGPSRATLPPEAWITPVAGRPPFPLRVSEGDGPVLKHGPRSATRMQGERT